MADHAPFYLSLQSSVRFPFYSIDWCLAPPCLAVLSAAKLDKSSLPFGARPVGLSGLKNFKGSIPFGAWLGLVCKTINISYLGALNCSISIYNCESSLVYSWEKMGGRGEVRMSLLPRIEGEVYLFFNYKKFMLLLVVFPLYSPRRRGILSSGLGFIQAKVHQD